MKNRGLALRLVLALCLMVFAPTSQALEGPRVLMMGDSFFAWNGASGQSVPHALARSLNARVEDRAISGAKMLHTLPVAGMMGLRIRNQYRKGNWDWVVMNGGGNDLWMDCGCMACNGVLNRLISADGRRGEIPKLVARARQAGSQVLYVGYLRTPGVRSPAERCVAWGDRLEARVSRLAALDRGIHFLSVADLVPSGDRSYHAADLVHPSPKGSAATAAQIARLIKRRSR